MRVLRTAWPVVVICLVLGLAAGWMVSIVTPKAYRATATIFVASAPAGGPADSAFAQAQVNSLTTFANAPAVIVPTIHEMRLKLSERQLAGKISVDSPANTTLINLHLTDHNPTTAAQLDNILARNFIEYVHSVLPSMKLVVVHPAQVPTDPIRPNRSLDIWLGGLAGFIVGSILVALRRFIRTDRPSVPSLPVLESSPQI